MTQAGKTGIMHLTFVLLVLAGGSAGYYLAWMLRSQEVANLTTDLMGYRDHQSVPGAPLLSNFQIDALKSSLAGSAGAVDIVVEPLLGEEYAKELKLVFDQSNWPATAEMSIFAMPTGQKPPAVILNVQTDQELKSIESALTAAQLPHTPPPAGEAPTNVREVWLLPL